MLRNVLKIAALVAAVWIIGHRLADPDLNSVLLGMALGMTVAVMFPEWLLPTHNRKARAGGNDVDRRVSLND